jgi:DUF3102 family protein
MASTWAAPGASARAAEAGIEASEQALKQEHNLQAAFDYSALSETIASEAKRAADRVRERLRGAVVDVGAELARIKERLPRGQFGPWLAAEFSLTERTAQNYMAAAALATKYETVSVLRPKTLYVLAGRSTPATVRQEIVERLSTGECLSDSAIQDMIGEAKLQEQCQRPRGERRSRPKPPEISKEAQIRVRTVESMQDSERDPHGSNPLPTIEQPADGEDALRVLENTIRLLRQRNAEVLRLQRQVRVGRAMQVLDALGIGINDLVPPGRR